MYDFFNFIQPQKNKIQYEFSMWRSPEMREGPHVQMMRLRMLLSRSCGSHVNLNFERMI